MDSHVVVFGCHGVARRVIRHLVQSGHEVRVIDRGATRQDREDLARWGATYVESSDHRHYTLQAAELERARAVLCIDEDDLHNLEMALLVREMSATVRIVVYTSNTAVNRALEPIARPGSVLDVAALSSKSIVEAVVGAQTRTLDLDGDAMVVTTVMCSESSTIRTQFGDLAPIAVQSASAEPLVACPARDHEVEVGDAVTLVGSAQQFARQHIDVSVPVVRHERGTFLSRCGAAITGAVDSLDRPFRIAFAVLVLLAVVSVVLLLIGYREPDGTSMNVLDAVYFTAETIGQVGFGDFYFRDQSVWLRIWSIFLIFFGILLVAVVTALLTNTLVTRRLDQSRGRQRLTGMSGHMIVVGLGSVGITVASELQSLGYEVAVIDRSEANRFIPQAREAGMSILLGDATLHETLTAAGVHRARGIAVLTSDDLVNIEVGLAVRDAVGDRELPVVLRVFERDLGRVLGRDLAIGTTRSTAELAAPWFVGAVLGLHIVSTFYVGPTPFLAAWVTVQPDGALDGLAMRDIAAQTRVIAIRRASAGGGLELPRRDTQLAAGDRAYLIGQYEQLLELLQRSEPAELEDRDV